MSIHHTSKHLLLGAKGNCWDNSKPERFQGHSWQVPWYSSGVACLLIVQQNKQQINRGHIELMLYVPCLILYQPAITKLYLWFHPKNCGIFNKSVDFLKNNAHNSIEIKKLLFLYGERRRRSPIFLPCKALSAFLMKVEGVLLIILSVKYLFTGQ